MTGASSGIGADMVRELAARGHGVTLVARREDKLRDLAGELSGDVRVEAQSERGKGFMCLNFAGRLQKLEDLFVLGDLFEKAVDSTFDGRNGRCIRISRINAIHVAGSTWHANRPTTIALQRE